MPSRGWYDAPPSGAVADVSRRGRGPDGCDPGGMHRRRSSAVLVAGTLLLSATGALAGCGQQTATDEAASTGGTPASVTAGGDATGAPPTATPAPGGEEDGGGEPFPGDTSADTADPVDPDGLTVTDVRIGAHDGFDRVVFDAGGQGTPGWTVEYVDDATAEGTGDPVDLEGPAYLRVVLTGITNPYEAADEERARGAIAAGGASAVTGAWFDGTFEGQSLAYIGTAAEQPFRVYALSGPTRVVVEVATD